MKKSILIGVIVLVSLVMILMARKSVAPEVAVPMGERQGDMIVQSDNMNDGLMEETVMEDMVIEEDSSIPDDAGVVDQTRSEVASLVAVGSYEGRGEATRAYNDATGFVHTVTADIADPAEGKFYEGWLVAGTRFFSTGEMTKRDQQYVLTYTDQQDQSDFAQVVITEETRANGLDGIPEIHVLEGEF